MQGIDLTNIIKDSVVVDKYETILTCLDRLTFAMRDKSYGDVSDTLQKLRTELDKDIDHRVFAGKRKGYDILIDLLKCCENDETIVKSALKTITALMTGNPDLLNVHGVTLQME